jgi:23S rRNA (uridine2552-2'-O)-methyltransferase
MTYRRKDAYYRRARAAGYRARSAYKLLDLDERFRVLHPGDLVIDLGAWPGGWLQVASERVGPSGEVLGVDVVDVEPLPAPNVRTVTGDVREPATIETIAALLRRPADVVLSDLAPKLTGVRSTDEARSAELVESVLGALPRLLRPGGTLLMKLFMGPGHRDSVEQVRESFPDVRTSRSEATRQGSSELYAVGRRYRPSTRIQAGE